VDAVHFREQILIIWLILTYYVILTDSQADCIQEKFGQHTKSIIPSRPMRRQVFGNIVSAEDVLGWALKELSLGYSVLMINSETRVQIRA